MRFHFRSRDKDGDYTIRSAIPENPILHANITALCLIEREILPTEVLRCTDRDFRRVRLWPWPWSDDLHIRTCPVDRVDIPHVQIWTSCVKAFESYRLTDIHAHTDTTKITLCLKKGPTCKLSVTLSNLNRFSKIFHCWKAYKIRYKTNTKLPTSP